MNTKASIVEELLHAERSLSGTKAGRELFNTMNIERFKRDRKEWMAMFERAERKRRMFDDMLNGSNDKKKRKAKNL